MLLKSTKYHGKFRKENLLSFPKYEVSAFTLHKVMDITMRIHHFLCSLRTGAQRLWSSQSDRQHPVYVRAPLLLNTFMGTLQVKLRRKTKNLELGNSEGTPFWNHNNATFLCWTQWGEKRNTPLQNHILSIWVSATNSELPFTSATSFILILKLSCPPPILSNVLQNEKASLY